LLLNKQKIKTIYPKHRTIMYITTYFDSCRLINTQKFLFIINKTFYFFYYSMTIKD